MSELLTEHLKKLPVVETSDDLLLVDAVEGELPQVPDSTLKF